MECWVKLYYHKLKRPVGALAKHVFELGMDCSRFCLNVFTGVICDILFKSGIRKHKVSVHDWLLLLMSKVNILTVDITSCCAEFQGDMNRYTLSCVTCGVGFGVKTDLVSVLGGAASAIMDHFGFGLE